MISGMRQNSRTVVLEKNEEISPRLLELREKIQDKEFLDNAIQRIAQVISNRLVDNAEELKFRN